MSIINNALSGSLAAQLALDATSQNIANVKTVGYTRQGALLAALGPRGNLHSAGSGVEVSSLMRFSDSYKIHQMWRAASDLGQRSVTQPYLTQLEQVMGDDESSISSGLDTFFSALNAASLEPSSTPLRQQIITAANTMAQRFNTLNDVMRNQRTAIRQQMDAVVPQINLLTKDIAALNEKIASMQATGGNASALIDARDQRIDTLSGLVGVEVVDQADGSRNVSLRSGQPLVIGRTVSTLSLQSNPDGSKTLNVAFANETFTVAGGNLGGQLGGLDDFQRNTLVPLQQSIADIAKEVSATVNAQLAAGFAADGSAGVPLFVFDASSATGMLKVSGSVQAKDLAFSADGTAGDSGNLQKLIGLKDQSIAVSSIGTVLLGDANTQLLGKLGMDSKQNQSLLATAETVRSQAKENWAATSGVNADEEAINLMEFQKMYQANMKVIAVANELFDSTLAMMA
ncbi:flagellar hook-associated protein FlgK [Noviherbaspirillum cavernae]|uniref:Flagellar hook-associated protein 1 n=1 Tax=Noviherbaspirillum cavernae TaxID=2320862 RepID=A0A418WVG4_9BURK|nr:flagellar hook-associated protein FlgK [Noviherbaspirillum cavernae]RJF96685.1 flagellar hook-associated protein FlgK [Noviherbaspirillum cavernae]